MKRISLAIVAIGLAGISVLSSGCKKKDEVNGLVASYTQSLTQNGQTATSTTTLTYDGQSRLTEVQQTGQSPITISYGSGQVTQSQNGQSTIFTLNSAGYAISDNQGNAYTYDNNGYNLTTTGNGTTTTNTISNGNVLNSTTTSNGQSTTINYSYLSDKDYRNFGQAFLGKSNVNLTNTQTVTSGGNSTTYTFSYTFDGKGRVQTETITAGTASQVTTYNYVNP